MENQGALRSGKSSGSLKTAMNASGEVVDRHLRLLYRAPPLEIMTSTVTASFAKLCSLFRRSLPPNPHFLLEFGEFFILKIL
jgi:hypothetical protein